MKRFTKTLVAAMIIAATGAVIMVGCKKEESAQMKSDVAQTEQGMSQSEQRIIDFLADFKAMKQGAKAEGEAMTPEQARWQWETTLNYCYGFTQTDLTGMRHDTLRVAMPKTDAQGNVDYTDLMTTYNDIVSTVRNAYVGIDMEYKTLQYVTISLPEEASKSGDNEIVIIMNTGRNDIDDEPWYGEPFENDPCWVWGLGGGSCTEPYSMAGDASDRIEEEIAIWDYAHRGFVIYCPNCEIYIENPYVDAYYYRPDTQTDSLFYVTGMPYQELIHYCICPEEIQMNFAWIMKHTHYEGMFTWHYNVPWYYKTEVKDCTLQEEYGVDSYTGYYLVKVWNATRRIRHYNGDYPISIDSEN